MNNFKELEEFITNNPSDWIDQLKGKPYSLKNIKQCEWMPDLWILNYNLFESDLTLPIVKQCRGTVVEIKEGKARVVCAPYLKFFNYGDPNCDEIDWNSAVIREKIDGQLIKAFKYNGYLFWISNGDFNLETNLTLTSKDIKSYKGLLFDAIIGPYKDHIPIWYRPGFNEKPFEVYNLPWIKDIPEGWTLMFELCSPYNRIIVDYPEVKLWFHGARDSEGNEWEPEEIAEKFNLPYEVPQKFDFTNINDALNSINKWKGEEHEGLVVCDKNYHRIKVKCADYLEEKFKRDFVDSLDRDDTIFQLVVDESYDDILPAHPEIKEHVDNILERLVSFKKKFMDIAESAIKIRKEFDTQKAFSIWVMKNRKKLSSIYFGATKTGNAEQYYSDIFNFKIKDAQGNSFKHFKELEKLIENGEEHDL